MSYVVITSKFAGHCRGCKTPMAAGVPVLYEPGTKGVWCRKCVDPKKLKQPTTPNTTTTTKPPIKIKKVKLSSLSDPDDDDVDLDYEPDPSPTTQLGTYAWPSSTSNKNYLLIIANGQATKCPCMGFTIRNKCQHVEDFNKGIRKQPHAVPPLSQPHSTAKTCTQCRKDNPPSTPICLSCGFSFLAKPIDGTVCPRCSKDNRPHADYCLNCGYVFAPTYSKPPFPGTAGTGPSKGSSHQRQSSSQKLADLAAKIKAGGLDLDDLSDMNAQDLRRRMAQAQANASSKGGSSVGQMPPCYYCGDAVDPDVSICRGCGRGPEPTPRHSSFDNWRCYFCAGNSDLREIACSKCLAYRGNIPSNAWINSRGKTYGAPPPYPGAQPRWGKPEPKVEEVALPPSWFKAMAAFQEVVVDMAMKPNAPKTLKPAFEKYTKMAKLAIQPGNDKEGLVALRIAMIELIKVCFDHIQGGTS